MSPGAAGTGATAARPSALPRIPRRERGIQRQAELLDALELLLIENHPDDVGLYGIAKQAKAPPASAYHFFPTREAAFVALAARHLAQFEKNMQHAIDAKAFTNWRTMLAADSRSSAEYLNAHPAALKLLIGRHGGIDVRRIDIAHNQSMSRLYLGRLQGAFEMPHLANAEERFHIMLEIQDTIWGMSYAANGRITADFREEAIRACISFLRCYYPEDVPLTPDVRQQVAACRKLILPVTWVAAS